jgi:hypothetical protein
VPKSSEWCLPFRLSDQNFVWISHLPHACYMPPSPISFSSFWLYLVKSTNYDAPPLLLLGERKVLHLYKTTGKIIVFSTLVWIIQTHNGKLCLSVCFISKTTLQILMKRLFYLVCAKSFGINLIFMYVGSTPALPVP